MRWIPSWATTTWVLADLPLGVKPFGCKWIFKRKLKVGQEETIQTYLGSLQRYLSDLPKSTGFVSAKESTQIYGAILPECLTSPAMKESKAYKTYLGYATGAVPPKIARKFKKASPSKTDTCVIIREAHVETKSKSKEKEKVDVTLRKGIKLLSEVALIEEAQMKEGIPLWTKMDSTESESESWGNDEDDSNNDD
ncbi:hypothetical protein Tco_1060187 [Tanacetum coccineum]